MGQFGTVGLSRLLETGGKVMTPTFSAMPDRVDLEQRSDYPHVFGTVGER